MTRALSRRQVVVGSSAFVATHSLGTYCACAGQVIGCFAVNPSELFHKTFRRFSFSNDPKEIEISPDSGDPDLDQALTFALKTLRTSFNVSPSFGFFDDKLLVGDANSAASPETLGEEKGQGSVIFGQAMLKKLMTYKDPGAAVLAVCAHEFGHIVSFQLNLFDELVPDPSQPFRGEQYADYMAGFFAGQRKLLHSEYPAYDFLKTLGSLAGGHHGTEEQRQEAVYQGYTDAYDARLAMAVGVYRGAEWAKQRPVT